MPFRLHIDGTIFRDSSNREFTLRGINVAADAKNPSHPDVPSHVADNFFDGDNVSFVGRPFTVDESHTHFGRLSRWGYNTLRYIFTWEALEHAGPRKYDEEFIQHTISILRIAGEYGFHVIMDPHQDVWSRFTGGSGAPLWTLYACGLNPRTLHQGEAALVQNTWPDPAEFPKMIWATNYTRMACQVLFTVFFAGRTFAPKAVIDGVNIQDYLQGHYIDACKHLAQRIKEAGDIFPNTVFAWESLNEPNRGMIGVEDISVVPQSQKLQKGTSPTAFQAMLTGAGRPCEIDTWDFGGLGPYKSGKQLVDPKGIAAWLPADHDDSKYGWKRDPGWKLGQCIWAQHGVWDASQDVLLRKDYFGVEPNTGATVDFEYFTNHFFLGHYRAYRDAIREVFPDTIMFCQGPVLEIPPTIKGTPDDDPNMVFAPHWYDGVTLINKKWNRWWNVDVFGVLRGKYTTPAFAIKIGETAIRNCFKDQLSAIRDEGMDHMGLRPTCFTEFGIPYDMDEQYAYKTGDYTSQIKALDANFYGMEGSKVNFCLWNYAVANEHAWGDQWNGEDLSIVSRDDIVLPRHSLDSSAVPGSLDRNSPSYSESRVSEPDARTPTKKTMSPEITVTRQDTAGAAGGVAGSNSDGGKGSGYRAAEAFVRPSPIATHGDLLSYGFDLGHAQFQLHLAAASATREDAPTEVFLPEFHFPKESSAIHVTGGKWEIVSEDVGHSNRQILRWWHAEGEQSLTVKGVVHKLQAAAAAEGSLLDECKEKGCAVM